MPHPTSLGYYSHFFRYFSVKLLPIILLTFFKTVPCYAWNGYDYEKRSSIEIGPGNLVREGLTIQFYDGSLDDFHIAKILLMEEMAGGTRLTVEDLDAKPGKKERIFIMEENS